jgi:hypothetical protein
MITRSVGLDSKKTAKRSPLSTWTESKIDSQLEVSPHNLGGNPRDSSTQDTNESFDRRTREIRGSVTAQMCLTISIGYLCMFVIPACII